MNSREHLAEDLERIIKRSQYVGYIAWLVAIIVMIYGTPIVFYFLTDHDIPRGIAWLLSLAADGALIVGLIATPVLAELGLRAGWVGALRWIAGFITWALQTAGSWTAEGGADMVGVLSHTAGPVLLFFSVEAASSFQRKVAAAITQKTRELAAAEQEDADRRAHLAETEAALRATQAELAAVTSDRDNHLREIDRLTAEITSAAEAGASETNFLRASVTELEAKLEALRKEHADHLRTQAEGYETRLREQVEVHAEGLRKAKQEARQARAEASIPHLADRRNRTSGGGNPATSKTPPRQRLSDEAAVQKILAHDPDLNREWNQADIVRVAEVGWGRAPRLLEAVTEEQSRRRSEATSDSAAVGQ